MAADFLGSFGVPYEVIGGNHDLEGIDEFPTDEANLEAFCRIHQKPSMQALLQYRAYYFFLQAQVKIALDQYIDSHFYQK